MNKEFTVIENTIEIGIKKPFKFLHMTDTHITRDDPTGWREGAFDLYPGSCEIFQEKAVEYAKKTGYPVLHTGDLIDFFSEGNFKYLDEVWSEIDYIYAAGNHDFCHFLGKAVEDYNYKWEMMKIAASHFKNNLYFYSRLIGEVNFVTLDNSYYRVDKGQLHALKAEVAKGYPIILGMHVPLYAETFRERFIQNDAKSIAVMAPPTEILDAYTDVHLRRCHEADKETLEFVEYIKNEPMIKALIVGHKHFNAVDMITPTLIQYTTTGTHYGEIREFTVV